jgi:hypothetical protein
MKIMLDIITLLLTTAILIGFKYFQGFENTICLIGAMVLIELWSLGTICKINKNNTNEK